MLVDSWEVGDDVLHPMQTVMRSLSPDCEALMTQGVNFMTDKKDVS